MNRYSRYTSRQTSLPAFMPSPNMYWPGGSLESWNALAQKDFQKNPWNYSQDYLYGGQGPDLTEQYMNSKNWLGISKKDNPFSKGNIGSTMQGIGAAASIIPEKPIKVGNIELKRGVWDAADPLYFLSDAKHTNAVGDTFSDAGVSLTKSGLQSGNPWIALAGGITKGLGSIVNAAFGGVDEEQKQKNDAAYNYYDSYKSNAKTYDDVTKFIGQDTFKGAYDGGWFRGGWARRHNAADYRDRSTAEGRAYTTRDNNLTNIGLENEMWARKHALAFGGPLDTMNNDNMGAIGFNFMSDYLTMKNNQNSKNNNNTQMPTFFSEGGKIHINPKNRGKFNATKKRTGKTTEELTHSKNPLTRKRAIFAQNAKKWRHDFGGYLNNDNLFAEGGQKDEEPTDATYVSKPLVYEKSRPQLMRKVTKHLLPIEQMAALAQAEARQEILDTALDNFFAGKPMPKVGRKLEAITRKLEEGDEEYIQQLAKTPLRRLTTPFNEGKEEYLQTTTPFAFGGNLGTNSTDWSTGLIHVDEGQSHELNPLGGVPMGVDKQGNPNLVEENEVIYDDYVFSARIPVDDETKQKFHIGKKKEITYADLAKKLEKEILERPNDPLSKAGFKAQMQTLEENQERQKQEMEAERARQAFEALPPEEQVAMMNRANQEEQIAQQATQEQAMNQPSPEEVAMAQGVSPEEIAMAEEQNAQGVPEEQPMAYGGNLYAPGGPLNLTDEDVSLIRRLFGNNKFTDNFEKTSAFLADPIDYMFGDDVEAAVDKLASLSQPQLERFFNTSVGQRVAELIDASSTSKAQEAGVQRWARATGRLQKPVQKAVVTAAKKALVQSKQVAKGQMKTPVKGSPRVLNGTQSQVGAVQQAVRGGNNIPAGYSTKAGPATVSEIGSGVRAPLNNAYSGATAVTPATPGADWASKMAGTLDMPSPVNVPWGTIGTVGAGSAMLVAAAANSDYRGNAGTTPKAIDSTGVVNEVQSAPTNTNQAISNNAALEWLTNNHPELGNKSSIAPALEYLAQKGIKSGQAPRFAYRTAYDIIVNGDNVGSVSSRGYRLDGDNVSARKHYQQLIDLGIHPKVAFGLAFPQVPKNALQYGEAKVKALQKGRAAAYKELVLDKLAARNTEGKKPVDSKNEDNFTIQEGELESPTVDTQEEATIPSKPSRVSNKPASSTTAPSTPNIPVSAAPQSTNVEPIVFGANQPAGTEPVVVERGTPEAVVVESPIEGEGTVLRDTTPIGQVYDWSQEKWVGLPETEEERVVANYVKENPSLVTEESGNEDIPAPKDHWLRYAGLYGPAAGLAMMAAGVGKPKYDRIDAALANLNNPTHATWKPIGDYLTYNPMDIWYEQNRLNANARATDRTIMNNSMPIGTKMAGLLANGYNNQIASGNLYRQALEYNDNQKARVTDFNRGTNMYNAKAFTDNSQFNATADNAFAQARAKLGLAAAEQVLDNEAGWYNSLYKNINNSFKGMSDLGRDKTEKAWLKWLADRGYFGNLGNKAEGGKIKKKRKSGLTY